jgi:hypothetical protein
MHEVPELRQRDELGLERVDENERGAVPSC